VDARAGALAGGVEAVDGRILVVYDDLGVLVRRDASHEIVGRRLYGEGLPRAVDPYVSLGELVHVGELLHYGVCPDVVDLQVDVVLAIDATALLDLPKDGAAYHVAAGQVLHARGVDLHEPLPVLVEQDAAFSPDALGNEDAYGVEARRVKLDELHVLQGHSGVQGHGQAVSRVGEPVAREGVVLGRPSRGEHHGLGVEGVYLSLYDVVSHQSPAHSVLYEKVQHEELVVEVYVLPYALAEEGVEDNVSGPVGGVGDAGVCVAPEGPLADAAVGQAAEGHTKVFQVDDGLDRVVAHDLYGVLVAEEVAPLDRIPHVLFPGVLAGVSQGRGDASLGGHRVAPGGVDLGDDRRIARV
jgi:hypothetical protein